MNAGYEEMPVAREIMWAIHTGSDDWNAAMRWAGTGSAFAAKLRLMWITREDRRAAIDPLTDHRIRLMANLIADAEIERQVAIGAKTLGAWGMSP